MRWMVPAATTIKTTCPSSRDGTGLYEIVKEDRGCTIVPLLPCLSLTHFDR